MTHPSEIMALVQTPNPYRPWQQLMEECSEAGGVFTTRRAEALGVTRKTLQRLASSGVIVREALGVYRVAGTQAGLLARARVATARGGEIVSHETAAALWGSEGFKSTTVHITVERGVARSLPPWVVVHTTGRSLRSSTALRHGVRLTRPLRTMLDLAGQPIGNEQLQSFLSFCIAERLFTVQSVERFVAANGRWKPGVVRLRRLLGSTSQIDSVAEGELLELLRDAGIPRPATQFAIREQGRFVARVDLAWPELRVALELDGFRYHSDAQTFVSDRERGNRIVGCGWLLLRTTPATVRDNPHSVIADLRAAFKRAGAA